MTNHPRSRDRKLSLLLAQTITLPTDVSGLLLWHEHDDPAADSPPKAALRRALSDWRTATLAAGADASAAWQALERFDAALAAIDDLLDCPTDADRQRLANSLTNPSNESEMK